MDNQRYKTLADQIGSDLASIIIEKEEERKKEKEFNSTIDRYGSVQSDAINITQQDIHRKRTEGKDFYLKDIEANFDNDPRIVQVKNQQEQLRQKESDDIEFWDKINKEIEREHKFAQMIREKHNEDTYQRYLANEKCKEFNKRNQE